MSALLPFLALNQTYEQVQAWAGEKLIRAGFRIVTTFDLRIARLAHPECPCPHHGTDACNCQLIVLLVYGKQDEPATLVLHGQDGKTWISLATPIEARSGHHLESSVRHTLIHGHPESFPSAEAAYGSHATG